MLELSKHLLRAPLILMGIVTIVLTSVTNLAAAELPGPVLTFDKREHRVMPDLGTVPRIRFLTTLDFPPFDFLDDQGRLSGFNVDLARELCDAMNVTARCQIQALPYDELQSALENHVGDAIIAGVSVTADLRAKFDFSRPYAQMPARFLASSKIAAAGAPGSAELASRKIGVVGATAHEAMLKTYFPALTPRTYQTRDALLAALKSGEVDAVFGDGMQLAFWKESADAAKCCNFWGGPYYAREFLGEGMTIMTRKGEPLVAAFDHGLTELVRDGQLNELFVKYFPPGLF